MLVLTGFLFPAEGLGGLPMSFPAPSPRAIPRVRSSPSRVYHACDHASTDFERFLKVDEDIQVVGPVQTESDHVYTSAAGRRPCVPGYLGTCVLSVKPGGSWEAVWCEGLSAKTAGWGQLPVGTRSAGL